MLSFDFIIVLHPLSDVIHKKMSLLCRTRDCAYDPWWQRVWKRKWRIRMKRHLIFLPQIKVRINVLFTILVSITAATLYVLFVMCEVDLNISFKHLCLPNTWKKISRHYKRGNIKVILLELRCQKYHFFLGTI